MKKLCLLKTSWDLQILFAAVTHLAEGLTLETLLTLKVQISLIGLVGTRRPTVSIIEQQQILFLKTFVYPFLLYCTLTVTRFFIFLWIYTQSVGLLGRVIGQSQGLYLNTGQHKHTHTYTHPKHPCPKWDSNPRSQRLSERRQFMP
jgi:hypothetical protein